MNKYIITSSIFIMFFLLQADLSLGQKGTENSSYKVTSSNLDLSKFVDQVYDLYQTDEVPAKKERLVNKKLSELLSNSFTMLITCSDSIAYDKKENKTTIKSREVYHADNKNGYFGVFVIVQKSGDDLLLNSSPDKEITISGTVTDMLVISYRKGMDWFKCRTPLNEFDDTGTIIQQIILKVQA